MWVRIYSIPTGQNRGREHLALAAAGGLAGVNAQRFRQTDANNGPATLLFGHKADSGMGDG